MDPGESEDREQALAVAMNALAEAVTIRGADNHVIYASTAALERLGFSSVEELSAADPHELLGPWELQVGSQTDDTAAAVMRMAPVRSPRAGSAAETERVTSGKVGSDAYDDQAIAV